MFTKLITIFFAVLMSCVSWAQSPTAKSKEVPRKKILVSHKKDEYMVTAYLFNSLGRVQRNENQDIASQEMNSYALTLRYNNLSSLIEYNFLNKENGNQTSQVQSQHQEYNLWGRYHFYNDSSQSDFGQWASSFFGGVGVGAYQEQITTKLYGNSRTDSGENQWIGGIEAGVQLAYLLDMNFALNLEADLRVVTGKDFDPNPVYDRILRFGLQYKFN